MTVADELDPPAVRAALHGLRLPPPVELNFQFVGQFGGGVLWLGPAPNRELLDHHATVGARLADAGIEVNPLYHPGTWVPMPRCR